MFRAIVSLGLAQALGILINAIRGKLFAVLLGPAGFGVVATIDQLVMSSVQISNVSLPFTALKFLSRSHSLSEERFRRTYAAFFKAMAFLALVATVVTLAVIPANLGNVDAQLAEFRGPVIVALLGIPAMMMLILLVNVLAARLESVRSVLLTVVSGSVILIAGGIGCMFGGVRGIYLGSVPASTLLMIGTVVYLRFKFNLSLRGHSSGVWTELMSNPKVVGITLCAYVAVASASVQLFLARYVSITQLSHEAAGLLQACFATAVSIGAVLGPASSLYFTPYVNRALPATVKIEATNQFLPRLVFLFCLGALPVLLFPESVLRILFSSRFILAAAALPWFVVWQCLYQIVNVYQQLLLGLDDAEGFSVVTVCGNLMGAAMSIFLVSRWGLLGIAIGFIAGTLISACLTAFRLHSKHGLIVPLSVPLFIGFALVGFLGVSTLHTLVGETTLMGLGIRLVTAAVFLLVLWLVLPPKCRSELSAETAAKVRVFARRFAS